MAKTKALAPTLKVYVNNVLLGHLQLHGTTTLSFSYDIAWLGRAQNFPISRSLPLQEEPYTGPVVYSYFDNLLPDNVQIRQRLAANMGAPGDDVFDLLSVIGRDCVGALQFIPEGAPDPTTFEVRGHTINNKDIAEKIRNLKSIPLADSADDDLRLSIAGAQEKTAFLKSSRGWQIPQGTTPTTHIFKPAMGELEPGVVFEHSVENEWLCAQIAEAFGLPVASCEMAQFEDITTLIVERFDRSVESKRILRLPQEDFCQALSVPSFKKYENQGGPGIKAIMDLLNESNSPAEDRRVFMKTQILFYLLAAIDGHGKNFSLQWTPGGFHMTPLYDILSAQTLVDAGKYPLQKIKMAMALGDHRHYKVTDITRRHFYQTAKLCRFSAAELDSILEEICAAIPATLDKVSTKLPKNFPEQVADSIFDGVKSRASILTL